MTTMMVVTTNDLPGYRIDEVLGEVWGLTVRSRNAFSQMGAGLKSIFGGELKGMTKALYDSRNEVMNRMVEEAQSRGANAILAMRFDTSEMGETWTEICAYGTAVRASKLSTGSEGEGGVLRERTSWSSVSGWSPCGCEPASGPNG